MRSSVAATSEYTNERTECCRDGPKTPTMAAKVPHFDHPSASWSTCAATPRTGPTSTTTASSSGPTLTWRPR